MNHNLLDLFKTVFEDFTSKTYVEDNYLHAAIRYALSGEGKRVRPLAAFLAATHYRTNPRCALSAATAVEMIHTYSLIHDDLPCMDNDDWRRGRPSLHRAFNEATALLAGDALLTDAFRVLSDAEFFFDASLVCAADQIKQIHYLSKAAGGQGMVLGQAKDLWWTGRSNFTEAVLNSIHIAKTGALMGASFAMGAASAGATNAHLEAWFHFGESIGLIFQAIDDTLDADASTGKTQGKDLAQGKLTYLRFHERQEIIELMRKKTIAALTSLPVPASLELKAFVEDLVFRQK